MHLIVLGDQVVDKYENSQVMYPGGNAMNFAIFAQKLGVSAAFLGAFGNDAEAACVEHAAKAEGVDLSHCRHYDGENGCARVRLQNGDRVFMGSNRCGVLRTVGLHLTKADDTYLLGFRLIHSSIFSYADEDIQRLHTAGATISFDFSDRFAPEYLEKMLCFVDFPVFSCSHISMEEMEKLMKTAVTAGCEAVLCTRGAEGAWLCTGDQIFHQQPHLVKAKDTMAAGDSFLTCFLIRYLQQSDSGILKEEAIQSALAQAAEFSAAQCMVDGSFGHGCPFNS